MHLIIGEPRVLTRPLTAVDNSDVGHDELLDLFRERGALPPAEEIATTSTTFSPAVNVDLSDSLPGYWLERSGTEEQIAPWRTFDSWRAMLAPVELRTSGTSQSSTTVTVIRHLLRRYRSGKKALFFQPASDLESLAAAQGVTPTADISKLRGDFWPDDDNIDDFVIEVRRWRDGEAEEDDNA